MAGNARTGGGRVDDFSCVGPLVAVDCVDIMAQAIAHRQFIRFWFARLSGVMANQMLMVAVAVAVAWHMYDITSSAWDLGLVGLFQFIPALLMTLPAGHVADRFHRGRIFAVCMLAQAVVAAWLVGATQWGHVTRELIFGLSVLLGMARAFQMPVQQSLTPMLVPHGTDSNKLRMKGLIAYGFTPMVLDLSTAGSMHSDQEHIPVAEFQKGLRIFYDVLSGEW